MTRPTSSVDRGDRNDPVGLLLDRLHSRFDRSFLSPDPLAAVVPRFADPRDLEIAGLIAACFAYGRADLIQRTVTGILDAMTPTPARFLDQFDPARDRRWMKGFVYRFHTRADLAALLRGMIAARQEYGGLKELFLAHDDPTAATILPGLTGMVHYLRRHARTTSGAFPHLLPDPVAGSASKRLNLYLRWMIRRDEIDPGPWQGAVATARLIMPLDVHVGRIARRLGLLTRKADDWRAAEELTRRLAQLDPDDPVKYDFALCAYGKLGYCVKRVEPTRCDGCDMNELCADGKGS